MTDYHCLHHANILDNAPMNTCFCTQGGEGTREEMCLTFLAYYPQINAGACGSLPRIPDAYAPFASQHVE